MTTGSLPKCATRLFDTRWTCLYLLPRKHEDWIVDLLAFTQGKNSGEHIGIEPSGMFDSVTDDQARVSLLPVSRKGAEDLLKLLAVGSFYSGPDPSLQEVDEVRDSCMRDILASAGEDLDFFTNHGHAENGDEADFLTHSFHWNSLATTLYDVCLIAVAADRLLIAWRFEDA
ncbi:hypothetical protein JHN63_28830 [Streptomyces sp. MBT65]|uniref:hypothetical protein n=1 Tax=Streptomyces sp. MBT65 TaxID=1488395 RepID=UPI00190953AF|nr:hypothetical protein [Streptomyces sp. MBT65]MBK3577734.1 hypothetical protein [Streptomyces sp. MBT65]